MGKVIRRLRLVNRYSQKDLATLLNVAQNTISNWENGIREPDHSTILKLSSLLNVTTDYLLGRDSNAFDTTDNPVRINVYGSIPAGIPFEAIEDIQGWEEIPSDWTKGGKKYIALIVKGDSMYPKYLDGDIVIIQLQEDCECSQDCACYVNGYEATLKRITIADGTITLTPLNPNYAPKTYRHPGEVTIIGIVKEIRRKV